MNLTTRWERGSVSRSASLQPQVLRVTDPRSGTPGSWRALFRFAHALGPGTDQVRTAGGPRPQRPRKDQGVGDFPGVLARATRCDRGPVAVRYFAPANSRATAGSWVASFGFANALGPKLDVARAAFV